MSLDPAAVATSWLADFSRSVQDEDIAALTSNFLPDGWLRDHLIFTWDTRSLHGHAAISTYLSDTLSSAQLSNFKVYDAPFLHPTYGPIKPTSSGVTFAFSFDTPIAHGRGFVRLLQRGEQWKAMSVFTKMMDLKGHEEEGAELGSWGGHTLSFESVLQERRAQVESEPCALIVGAGQAGLMVAARFKQMGIRSIVLEKNARVGDNWRKRYPTLSLHTPKTNHAFLYHSFPSTWPVYSPRDKLADFMEFYATAQELVVWTSSTLLPRPIYDTETKRWSVTVDRNGTEVRLSPSHIVLAAGAVGPPRIPDIPTLSTFTGEVLHSSRFNGAAPYKGKNVVVVGAGNSSADICQDCCFQGASSVTMVQRSSTTIVTNEMILQMIMASYPEGVPTDVLDFKETSMPWGLKREVLLEMKDTIAEAHREMHAGLRSRGFDVNLSDGTGTLLKFHSDYGGYWQDVGTAQLIIDGKVGVKHGVEISRCTKNTVIFSDDSELEADVLIFATGQQSSLEAYKKIFDPELIEQTPHIWGFDDESELRGVYRRTSHPALWYAGGDFGVCRFGSKNLALLIKATDLGLIKE